MNRSISKGLTAVTLSAALLLTGCANTKIVGSWADPDFTAIPVRNVLVVGVTKNSTGQRLFESTLTWALEDRGVAATPGHSILPDDAKVDKAAIEAAIAGKGFDAVLVTRKVKVSKNQKWVKGATYAVGSPYYGYGRMYPYYSSSYRVVHEPGYLETEKVIQVESNLYATATGELIWTARSDTVDPKDLDDAIEGVSKVMVGDLRDRGFVP